MPFKTIVNPQKSKIVLKLFALVKLNTIPLAIINKQKFSKMKNTSINWTVLNNGTFVSDSLIQLPESVINNSSTENIDLKFLLRSIQIQVSNGHGHWKTTIDYSIDGLEKTFTMTHNNEDAFMHYKGRSDENEADFDAHVSHLFHSAQDQISDLVAEIIESK